MCVKSKMNFVVFLSFVMSLISSSVQARDLSLEEVRFSLSYADYLRGDNGYCADDFYATLVGPPELKEPLLSRARLYLAVCQYRLGLKPASAYSYSGVNKAVLNEKEKALADQLEPKIQKEIDAMTGPFWTLIPYYGQGTYSETEPSLKSSQFAGLEADVAVGSWAYKMSAENLSIKTKTGTGNYSQNQWVLGAGYNVSGWESRLRLIGVSSSNSSYNNILAVGAGVSYWLMMKNRLSLDIYSTKYPTVNLGTPNVTQVNISTGQALYSDKDSTVMGQLGVSLISISNVLAVDPDTAIKIEKSYTRPYLDLSYFTGSWMFSLGISAGKEMFGIRNDGAVLYSAATEQKTGTAPAIKYSFDASSAIQVGASNQSYSKGDGTTTINASVTSYSLMGIFSF